MLGPTLPPPPSTQVTNADVEMTEVSFGQIADKALGEVRADDSSDETLIDVSIPNLERRNSFMSGLEIDAVQQQQNILDDKENLPPSKATSDRAASTETALDLLGPASPSRMNRLARPLSPVKEAGSSAEQSEEHSCVPPPNRPPPVPPRPENDPKEMIQEQLEIGAQQDVTEVIGNVLFQLQCAIKPERIDAKGEQIDIMKRVFYGKQKSNTINLQGVTRTKEEFFSDIKVNVASHPCDMYAALDGAFDLQEVEVDGAIERQYTTISQIPPVLQVHITRGGFDKEKQTTTKSNHHIKMKPTLYMDRYLDSTDPDLLKRRQECWAWKDRLVELEALKQKEESWGSEALPKLIELLGQINSPEDPDPVLVESDFVTQLKAEEDECKKRLEGGFLL